MSCHKLYVYNLFVRLVQTYIYMLIPTTFLCHCLKDGLNNLYDIVGCEYTWTASGRSALALLYSTIRKNKRIDIDTVLLPDYICNVVYEAANKSGMHIIQYTTEDYMPCMDDILRIIRNNHKCCVTFVSYFGRNIDYFKIIATIRAISGDTIIIFDECQNLFNADMNVLEENIFSVLSFNNKMTPGLLGGVIISRNSHFTFDIMPEPWFKRIIRELEVVLSYSLFFLKMIKTALNDDWPIPATERSSCQGKYGVEPKKIYKVSLAAAYLGVKNTGYHKQILKHNLKFAYSMAEKGIIRIIGHPNTDITAYLPIEVDSSFFSKIPLKGEYWVSDNENKKGHIYMVLSHSLKYCYKE